MHCESISNLAGINRRAEMDIRWGMTYYYVVSIVGHGWGFDLSQIVRTGRGDIPKIYKSLRLCFRNLLVSEDFS